MEAPGPDDQSIVDLPPGVDGPFELFVNGVRQQPGTDFDQVGRSLVFRRRLAREGRLGFWRWSSIFFGVAGSYKKNDTVDLVYSVGARRVVAPLTPRAQDADASRPA
ncbi:MAG: hypothetical protein H0X39_05070 [Actinobacteria bacterium]|nr:hypothetical protein [Actinomycetota bacterium]